jgi:predicted ATP-dependent endonuclease of OLD family
MEIIKSIKIRKFRSIKSLTSGLQPSHLNIFVGQNDQGKSNILRALNLFFNNQTDNGRPFRFEEDYCYHAGTGTGTRKEVRIDLIIEPPKHRFKHAKPLCWTKRWKMDGAVIEDRFYVGESDPIKQTDNVYKWLDKIRFRYVPAVKGSDYFSTLMGELHDVLNAAHSEVLTKQGQKFISGIQKITSDITNELEKQINLASAIQVPSDFRNLFSNLDFGSKLNNNTYHLKQRGDGIKARHIPIILKYMAEQEKNIAIPGYVKPDTIWGFEEPENNLELKFSFELAKNFLGYSKDIQVFLTTHSPAFYALDKTDSDGVLTFYVSQDSERCTVLRKTDSNDTENIHEAMGLLPLITPYLSEIYEKQQEIENLQTHIDTLPKQSKCVILTEDENHGHLLEFLKIHGFNSDELEIISYQGADNLKSSLMLAKYIDAKFSEVKIIVHRDQDYLSEQEIQTIREKIESNGYTFLTTTGVDVESEYLNSKHINFLYPEITIEVADEIINLATKESRNDSLKRLTNHILKSNKPTNNDYFGEIQKIESLYDSNPARYRYGKKVLGLSKAKLQKKLGLNIDLYRKSSFISNQILLDIANELWGSN